LRNRTKEAAVQKLSVFAGAASSFSPSSDLCLLTNLNFEIGNLEARFLLGMQQRDSVVLSTNRLFVATIDLADFVTTKLSHDTEVPVIFFGQV
jgi:hypothetical protein